jgi:hypothetical protein
LLILLCALPASAVPATLGKPGTGVVMLTAAQQLVTLSDSAPTQISPPLAITGVSVGDFLVAIDVRPLNQELYGLGVNPTADTFQLYHISPVTGFAAPVGLPNGLESGGLTLQIEAARYGIDFNPAADRLRVVTSAGVNFRMNPNTGVCVDGDAVTPGTNPDGAVNGLTTTLDDAAYTNNEPGVTVTTLYTIDQASDAIYIQNPANNGTQISKLPVKVSGIPLAFSGACGFDIPVGVNVATSGTAATGSAYAVLDVGTRRLYRINLGNGEATQLAVPSGVTVLSLAVRTQLPTAVALDAGGSLVRFRRDNPAATSSVAISGLALNEALVGIDYRPATGQLYGLAINSSAGNATLYLIDQTSGSLTAVGAQGSIQFVNADGVTPVPLPPASDGYGVDFNPTADRLRISSGNAGGHGINFRVNPSNGFAVDGDLGGGFPPGVNPDSAINGAATGVTASAYTNSHAAAVGTTVTTLYTLDPVTNSLFIQTPPNAGTLTAAKVVKVNGATLDFTVVSGFDITTEGGTSTVANGPSAGEGWAALMVGGVTSLYRIDLRTGNAVNTGLIGSGAGVLVGLTVAGEDGAGFAPLGWTSVASASYRIETSSDLVNWQPYGGTIVAAGTSTTVPVPWYEGEKKRFWRVILP